MFKVLFNLVVTILSSEKELSWPFFFWNKRKQHIDI